jgi:hypothetical protein
VRLVLLELADLLALQAQQVVLEQLDLLDYKELLEQQGQLVLGLRA